MVINTNRKSNNEEETGGQEIWWSGLVLTRPGGGTMIESTSNLSSSRRRASQKVQKRREPRRTRRARRRAFLFLCGLRVLRGSRLLCCRQGGCVDGLVLAAGLLIAAADQIAALSPAHLPVYLHLLQPARYNSQPDSWN